MGLTAYSEDIWSIRGRAAVWMSAEDALGKPYGKSHTDGARSGSHAGWEGHADTARSESHA